MNEEELKNDELSIFLYKKKESSWLGGEKAVANAAIFVKNITASCEEQGEVDRTFNLFNQEGTQVGGQVRLVLKYLPDKEKPKREGPKGGSSLKDVVKKDSTHFSKEEEVAAKKIQSSFREKMSKRDNRKSKKKTMTKKKTTKSNARRGGSGGLAVVAALVIGFLVSQNKSK